MGNMDELDKDLLDTFRKVEVNMHLLDAIKQIPRYAKFLKDLCTHKRKRKASISILESECCYINSSRSVAT
ncbi:hypothetical protein Lal_00010952 [Lupinus albus]|nr:hypothetical protein Lal_00010952 [Lupinus albus]